jgi:ADP-ribosylglycohydrolase
MRDPRAAALRSLEGLALGDAFGQLFFGSTARSFEELEPGPWRWTDDTHMALSIVEVLERFGAIDQDALADAFARRYAADPFRGYAGGAARLLRELGRGGDWRELAPALFGTGSYGNGGAMRVAPLGAWFEGDPARAAQDAARSAQVTHAHPEGEAGAIAVAVAAAMLPAMELVSGPDALEAWAVHVPPSLVRDRILEGRAYPADDPKRAAAAIGSGFEISAQDTAPYCLWMAANCRDFETALWCTAWTSGDIDTTCAIVGGILANSVDALPAHWLARREALPATRSGTSS